MYVLSTFEDMYAMLKVLYTCGTITETVQKCKGESITLIILDVSGRFMNQRSAALYTKACLYVTPLRYSTYKTHHWLRN